MIARAIEGLPDHDRAVLVLRDVEGLSNEDVAAGLGDTVSSVKSRCTARAWWCANSSPVTFM